MAEAWKVKRLLDHTRQTADMAIAGGLFVDRLAQIEALLDGMRTQVEKFLDVVGDSPSLIATWLLP